MKALLKIMKVGTSVFFRITEVIKKEEFEITFCVNVLYILN